MRNDQQRASPHTAPQIRVQGQVRAGRVLAGIQLIDAPAIDEQQSATAESHCWIGLEAVARGAAINDHETPASSGAGSSAAVLGGSQGDDRL
jgi:hypothetical protein